MEAQLTPSPLCSWHNPGLQPGVVPRGAPYALLLTTCSVSEDVGRQPWMERAICDELLGCLSLVWYPGFVAGS